VANVLEVLELWKTFSVGVRGCSARISVLRGVTFHVAEGERVGIVGPRGVGKTTLLHCLVGLRRPDAGLVKPCPLAPGTILMLDDGMPAPDSSGREHAGALLLFARHEASLLGRVERVLALRDGRITAMDPPVDSPLLVRRVAEPSPRIG
jgi:predicted ABC-type transport system involved in lysophospholipase L1 biosynthesis ATPase subunit